MLYGGCPPKELRHKFLMAQESDAAYLTADVLPEGFRLLPLPGHCMDMVGFRTPDDVVYLADCVSSRETLEKYRIGYIYDVGAYLATLETVKAMTAKAFVPAHAEVTEDIAPLAQYNIDTVQEVSDAITALCAAPGVRYQSAGPCRTTRVPSTSRRRSAAPNTSQSISSVTASRVTA